MPIYEFRWQTHKQVLSQGGDSSYCPVVKWDGNDGEPFSAKIGADPFSSLRGNKPVVFCWTERKKAQSEKSWKEDKDRWQFLQLL